MPANSSIFQNTYFFVFVGANFISSVGTFLFTTGCAWLMTEMGAPEYMTALVQTAAFLPMVLFVLHAGAVGELYDQRKIILITQTTQIVLISLFAYLIYQRSITTWTILLFTLVTGTAGAFTSPVLAALVPQIVKPRDQLRKAIDINTVFNNISQAIGPILAGWMLAKFTTSTPFWIDAATFLTVIAVMWFWKDRRHDDRQYPAEPMRFAMADTLRFVRHAPALYDSMFRAVLFFIPASAFFALLPVVADQRLGGDATDYGVMLGGIGAGALLVMFFTDKLTEKLGASKLTMLASILLGVTLAGMILVKGVVLGTVMTVSAGVCYQVGYTAIMTSAQSSLPDWFQSRGMSVFMMTLSAGMGLGSIIWGLTATFGSLEWAFYGAAGLSVLFAVFGSRFRLDQAKDAKLDPVADLPIPEYLTEKDHSDFDRPVLVQHVYALGRIDEEKALHRLRKLKSVRARNGGRCWSLLENPEEDGCLVESYYIESKTHVLRQLGRVMEDDHSQVEEVRQWLEENGGEAGYRIFGPARSEPAEV